MTQFFSIFLLGIIIGTHSSRVLDLTDSFLEDRKEGGYWLIKFYAPWCGHCKKLEPEWAHVSQALARSDIKVRRIDCSRFPSVASEFAIRGYPTIKFITKDDDFTFNGDRNKDDIVNFAIRMAGPAVQEITQPENLAYIKNVLKHSFFMYVGEQKDNLWENFKQAASKWQPYCFFYSTKEYIAKQHLVIPEIPTALVHKENATYYFTVDKHGDEKLNISLYNWINEERFESFPKITRGNINEILRTSKYIVLVVVEEDKFKQVPLEMLQFMNKVEMLVKDNRNKYHKHFQFGWVGNPELANSIAMEMLPLPYLLVLNSTNYFHYVPDDEVSMMTAEAIDVFLERVYNQTVHARGGNGILARIYRTYFDTTTAVVDMWKGNPILTMVLFGLPCIFLSFILYSICCAEISDTEEEDEEEMHLKKE